MLYLLSKTETRMIDLGDGFFAEVHVDTNSIGTKRKIIITNSDYPEVQYLAASSNSQYGALIESESDITNILKNADNFKEAWYRKISEIDMIRRQFRYNYCFSVKKCKVCPMRETCKVGKSKCHTYSVTCISDVHKARLEFESSEEFTNKMHICHRIEEKNGEMKTAHGFRRADSAGLVAMRLQAYFTAMVVNMKRITAVIPG